MTRVNLINPQELHYKHLVGEYREITRIFGLVRKAQERGINKWNYDIPKNYTMGIGHMKFFSDKLGFIVDRYHSLCNEMRRRGYKCNEISRNDLLSGIRDEWVGSYDPTPEALRINRRRIEERLKEMNK